MRKVEREEGKVEGENAFYSLFSLSLPGLMTGSKKNGSPV